MAQIAVNGEERELTGTIRLSELLDSLALPLRLIAVEVNGNVIKRTEWETTEIGDGDRLEVVHFVGGG
ncbi:MAG: sulfur carrier protein ThiS [Acidobacteria bacterium]|nr:sulfur carrier protein ThiS [Acidobacteriota bacterium]MCW5950140.1 sulfur carrier protein ThiS [Pyrinomonadaceae bacterium]